MRVLKSDWIKVGVVVSLFLLFYFAGEEEFAWGLILGSLLAVSISSLIRKFSNESK